MGRIPMPLAAPVITAVLLGLKTGWTAMLGGNVSS